MATDPAVPEALRERVLPDLRPVRPLWAPWKRSLGLLPLGGLLVLAVVMRFGVREDWADLGVLRLWGLSALQLSFGGLVLAAALRGAVPGRGPARRVTALLLAAGIAFVFGVMAVSWGASPVSVSPALAGLYWRVCLRWTVLLGVPVLGVAWGLVARGYPVRPATVGALAGLGAGLMADAAWRTYCEVSEPSHVLTAHLGGVLVLCFLGAVSGHLLGRWLSQGRRP